MPALFVVEPWSHSRDRSNYHTETFYVVLERSLLEQVRRDIEMAVAATREEKQRSGILFEGSIRRVTRVVYLKYNMNTHTTRTVSICGA
jgi:hypothetical protein